MYRVNKQSNLQRKRMADRQSRQRVGLSARLEGLVEEKGDERCAGWAEKKEREDRNASWWCLYKIADGRAHRHCQPSRA